MTIIGYNISGNKIGEAIIKEEQSMLFSPKVVMVENEYLIVGYYTDYAEFSKYYNTLNDGYVKGYNGLFVARLDKNLNVLKNDFNRFSEEFLTKGQKAIDYLWMMDRAGKKLLTKYYTISDKVIHNDGTLTILSEYRTIDETRASFDLNPWNSVNTMNTTSSASMTPGVSVGSTGSYSSGSAGYIYGPIIYFHLKKDDGILVAEFIKKMQVGTPVSKMFWSYSHWCFNGEIYILFNDLEKNEESNGDKPPKYLNKPDKSIPYIVRIDPNGNLEKKPLEAKVESDTYLAPKVAYRINEKKYVMWSVRKKQNQFATVGVE